ncbi:hypothetical protein C2845_PM07G16210 [Panicum miliaceum]|uniref:KIB1-4 beta-propeller domain-containing protein n=1 Tax=Panicum miliaceum TaxID=4540 RepID=A0A3L6SS05_PANMI|nr:hypothetical protein C2845_PM07G16210 [Panicum miliaceum]
MPSLDLNGSSPVARKMLDSMPISCTPAKYLVQTPACDILQVWRLKDHVDSLTLVDIPPNYMDEEEGQDPCLEQNTVDIDIYKVDLHGQRLELMKGLPDYALFLSFNASMCLPVKDFDRLKPNSTYITDDCPEYVNFMNYNKREASIWSMAEQNISKFVDVSVLYP